MKNRRQEDLIREAVREILVQEGFLGDLWSGIKTGTGKIYDLVAGALGPEEPKSGLFKALDDLSPDIPTQKLADFFTQISGSDNDRDDEFDQDDSSSLEESPIKGVMQKHGVVWTDSTLEFVEKMRAILDPSIPMTITSAARTERDQANAMLKKWQLGGDDELRKIYGRKAEAFILAPKNPETWEQIIRDRNARKQGTSPHLRGVAVDVRTRDLSASQVDALISAARAAGGTTLLEDTPPHLHIDGFAESSGQLYT